MNKPGVDLFRKVIRLFVVVLFVCLHLSNKENIKLTVCQDVPEERSHSCEGADVDGL